MNKNTILVFCFVSIISATIVHSASAQSLGTVYIDSDGSVKGTDSILRNGDKYTLTSNIFGTLTVQCESVTVDGAGHIIKGDGNSQGILIANKNVTINNFQLSNHFSGIESTANNNTISGNYITECAKAITIVGDSGAVLRNYVEKSDQAITLQGSHTFVSKNNLAYNRLGIVFNNGTNFVKNSIVTENNLTNNMLNILVTSPAADNLIYNNNFVGGSFQVNFQNIPNGVDMPNAWDNGTVGNYWSDYLTSYANAKEVGSTGTGDTPYVLTHSPKTVNMDNHPLLTPVVIPDLAQGPQSPPSTPKENTWTPMAPMPTARGGLGVVVVNGKIFAIGGLSYTSHLTTNEMYNPATNTWTTMAAMPTARSDFGITVYQNKIYCIGGQTGEVGAIKVTGANEVYDPAMNTWEEKAELPTPRGEMQANTVNGKIYVMGGTKFLGFPLLYQSFSDNDVYDPENDSWSTSSALPTASWNYASTVLDYKIYIVCGGAQGGVNRIYDPSTNTWASGAAIPSKFFSLSAAASSTTGALAPKRIYVMGGTTVGEDGVSVNQAYNPYNDSWSTVASMPTARYSLSIATINDSLYAIGGFTGLASGPNGWIPTDANEKYLPINYGTTNSVYQASTPTPSYTPTISPTATQLSEPTLSPSIAPSTLPTTTPLNEGTLDSSASQVPETSLPSPTNADFASSAETKSSNYFNAMIIGASIFVIAAVVIVIIALKRR